MATVSMFGVHTGSDCITGKAQYATKAAALEAMRHVRRRKERGVSLNAYRCAWCECFHIGNKGGNTSKGRRRR